MPPRNRGSPGSSLMTEPASAASPPLAPRLTAMREVRARIVRDLTAQYPPSTVERLLKRVGWTPTRTERAIADAADLDGGRA